MKQTVYFESKSSDLGALLGWSELVIFFYFLFFVHNFLESHESSAKGLIYSGNVFQENWFVKNYIPEDWLERQIDDSFIDYATSSQCSNAPEDQLEFLKVSFQICTLTLFT